MKRLVLISLLVLLGAQAPPPPKFVPFTVEQAEFERLGEYLMRQPMGVVEPMVQWLRQKETDAQKIEAAKESKAKQDDLDRRSKVQENSGVGK